MTDAFISDPATSIAFGIIVVLSVFMTTMQTLLVSKTAQQSSLPPGARAAVPIWVGSPACSSASVPCSLASRYSSLRRRCA